MKKNRKVAKTFVLLLAVFMLMTCFFVPPAEAAKKATVTKTEKHYSIAVVFDNSGSMYYKTNAWARAKYSMEIFASMLDFEGGDELSVFPMCEVYTDGDEHSSGGSIDRIDIKSKDDIKRIHNLYTIGNGNTPAEPISEAQQYLKSKSKKENEKWLVVLTDGAFDRYKRKDVETSQVDIDSMLLNVARSAINVQYLGIGVNPAAVPKENTAEHLYVKNTNDSKELQNNLINICNKIFQRNELPASYQSGGTIKLDLSMNKLIVFAQGADAKIVSLKTADGTDVEITQDSGQRTYSTLGCSTFADAPTDTSLSGQVVTFGACPKGTYTLNASGADKVQIFYEPNVDIFAEFLNSDGQIVDLSSGEIFAGDYTLSYKLIDGVTADDVSKSPLLGSDLVLIAKKKRSDEEEYTDIKNGDKITLAPDETGMEFYIEGTYLTDYHISSKDSNVIPPYLKVREHTFEIKVDVLEQDDWYILKEHESWKPIFVSVEMDGHPAADEELALIDISAGSEDANEENKLIFRKELASGQSGFYFYVGQDPDGNYIEPGPGMYTFKASASWTPIDGKQLTSESSNSFNIQKFSNLILKIIGILIALGILAAIAIAVLTVMNQKVLPKDIIADADHPALFVLRHGRPDEVNADVTLSGNSLTVVAPSEIANGMSATFALEPESKRKVKSCDRVVRIVGVDGSECDSISINSVVYNYDKRQAIFVPTVGVPGPNGQIAINQTGVNSPVIILSSRTNGTLTVYTKYR